MQDWRADDVRVEETQPTSKRKRKIPEQGKGSLLKKQVIDKQVTTKKGLTKKKTSYATILEIPCKAGTQKGKTGRGVKKDPIKAIKPPKGPTKQSKNMLAQQPATHSMFECERKMVKDLCLDWNMDEPRAQKLLDISSRGLTYSVGRHMVFAEFVQSAWDAAGLPRYTREGNHNNITFTSPHKSEKRIHKGKRRDLVELVLVEPDNTCLRYRTTRPEFECLLSTLLCSTWKNTVRRIDMIPSSISRAMSLCRLEFQAIFHNLRDEMSMPWWISLTVNTQRMQQNAHILAQAEVEGSAPSAIEAMAKQLRQQQRHPGSPADSFSAQMDELLKESRITGTKQKRKRLDDSDDEEDIDDSIHSSMASAHEELCFSGADGYTVTMLPAKMRVVNKSVKLECEGGTRADHMDSYWSYMPAYREMNIHPYAMSLLTYGLAEYLSQTLPETQRTPSTGIGKWTATRIYHFLRAWMASEESAINAPTKDIPLELANAGNLLVAMLSSRDMMAAHTGMDTDPGLCEDLVKLVELMQNTHTMLDMHRARDQRKKGRFHKFRLADDAYTKQITEQYFFCTDAPAFSFPTVSAPGKEDELKIIPPPSSISLSDLSRYKMLLFDANEVSPLDLRRSVDILERWCFRSTRVALTPVLDDIAREQSRLKWHIMWDDKHTMLLGDKERLFAMIRFNNAYLPTSVGNFTRNVDYPLYAYHVHAFFYGGRKGIHTCMKFMLKSFCRLKCDTSNLKEERSMLPDATDAITQVYSVLANIIARFGTYGALWRRLTEPLKKLDNLRFTSLKMAVGSGGGGRDVLKGVSRHLATDIPQSEDDVVYGIKEDCNTIYQALRAFVLLYAPHTITYKGLRMLDRLFTPGLQILLPIPYSLVKYMIEQAEREGKYLHDEGSCDIPADFFQEEPNKPVPFPAHIFLYLLLADDHVTEDTMAAEIFLTIGCRTKRRNKSRDFPLHFTSPPPPKAPIPGYNKDKIPPRTNTKLDSMFMDLNDAKNNKTTTYSFSGGSSLDISLHFIKWPPLHNVNELFNRLTIVVIPSEHNYSTP